MKYLLLGFSALPLIASCTMVQEDYYAPPPPRVEVQRYYPQPSHYHQQTGYRPAPRGRQYNNNNGSAVIINQHGQGHTNVHGHAPVQARTNAHGHAPVQARTNAHGHAPVQARTNVHGHVPVQAHTNVHGHTPVQTQTNVHGHGAAGKPVSGLRGATVPKAVLKNKNTHINKTQQSTNNAVKKLSVDTNADANTEKKTHGHS